MPNSYYTCGQVCIGDERHDIKFSKYARHDKSTLVIDAISKSVEKKTEDKLGLSVMGVTNADVVNGKQRAVIHLGKKEDGAWIKHGYVSVSF